MAIDGFDPLGLMGTTASNEVFDEAVHRSVLNILKCYTGFFDLFSEMIQNALDAVEMKYRERRNAGYTPKIWIYLDMKDKIVRVIDNGIGMNEDEFKLCFCPNVSYKKNKSLRGQKGVGATFIAYGYNYVKLQTKRGITTFSAQLRSGKLWAEDSSGRMTRPVLEDLKVFDCDELNGDESGTSIEVRLTGSSTEKPRSLDWFGARTANQWTEALRIKTALGGVYLTTPTFRPKVMVTVKDEQDSLTYVEKNGPTYYYPHEIPDMKVQEVEIIRRELDNQPGDAEQKQRSLRGEYKRLDCIWDLWDSDAILREDSPFCSNSLRNRLNDEQKTLIRQYNVHVYAAFLSSTKHWDRLNDDTLSLRRGQKILRGGLQMACDYMVQGELITIPLTKAIGYQNNCHVIVHFNGGNPDLGRKTFQPEFHELAEMIAVQAVSYLTKYRNLMKPDTGAVVTPDLELYEWKKAQERWLDSHPIKLDGLAPNFSILSEPQEEQDVQAIFHQLIGVGVIKGIELLSTKFNDRYDGLFRVNYNNDSYRYCSDNRQLGVSGGLDIPFRSEPKVLEFKYDLDALVRDFENETKNSKHIDLAVCWEASGGYSSMLNLAPYLVGDNGSDRVIYGSTHAAYPIVGAAGSLFEVIVLHDLIRFMQNPISEAARQRTVYET